MLNQLTLEELSQAFLHLESPLPSSQLSPNLQQLKPQEWTELASLLMLLAWERSQSPLH